MSMPKIFSNSTFQPYPLPKQHSPAGPQLGPTGAHLGPNGAIIGPIWNAAWICMDYFIR